MGDLEALLKQSKKYRKRLLITDGVFSTEGDIAPLDEIVKLAEEYDVVTYLDDSHGDGVMGLNGKGTASHFGVEDKIDVAMGGFSKAFGVIGGYLAGSKELIETAKTDSLTWTNTTAPPPTIIAACSAALDVVQTEPQIIEKLWRNTEHYKESMREMGYDLGKSVTPISPVIVENDKKADRLSQELFKEGVWGGPYKKGLSRIRTIMNAGLEREDIDTVLGVFEKVGKKLDIL
jgi:glycine C-acetyltransferase